MQPPLTMSMKEINRMKIIAQLDTDTLMVEEAATVLGISVRQTYRLLHRYRLEGDRGLIHRSRGRPSNRRKPEAEREKAVALYWSAEYRDYGATQFSEVLASTHGIKADHETVRRWLQAAGGMTVQRRKRPHRRRRQRRGAIGSLVQFDGSHHDWFEGRGKQCCLLHAIDDATSRTFLRFAESENTHEVFSALKEYCQRHGIPQEIYVDRHAVYYEEKQLTEFGRAMRDLGVRIRFAHSAEAKGRVERGNRTHQDRLIKALRRKRISTIEGANAFLDQSYHADHNQRFASTAEIPDIHRSCEGYDLDRIFSFQHTRQVRKDYTIMMKQKYIQLQRSRAPLPPPKYDVTVCDYLDGSRHIFWGLNELAYEILEEKPCGTGRRLVDPSPDHPWRNARPIGRARRQTIEELCHKK